jgi:hypothetical protein
MKKVSKKIDKINDKDAIIKYKSSKSTQKEEPKFNIDTIKVIDELLKGSDIPFLYDEGITTLNTFNDRDEVRLDITRIANHILELRKVIPNGWLLTFRYLSDKKSRYGLIKDKSAIKFLEDLKARLETELKS